MVILSVGQGPDRSWARGTPVQTDSRGRIVVNRDTHLTSHPRVFLAGESLRGPGAAIEAVADGHRVAEVVARFLDTGRVAEPLAQEDVALEPFPTDVVGKLHEMHSVAAEPEPFADAEPVLSEAEARREGGRCLGCLAGAVIDETKCASCLTCYRVCPLDAVEIGETAVSNPVRCQACGLCASVCPAGAISLSYWQAAGLAKRRPAARAGEEATIALVCEYRDDAGDEPAGTLRVPCLARLKPVDLLRLFGQGCQVVELYPCEEEQCKYGSAWRNCRSVVEYVRGILGRVRPDARVDLYLPEGAKRSDEGSPGEAR